LQRTTTHCNTLQHTGGSRANAQPTHSNLLQYTATHCNNLVIHVRKRSQVPLGVQLCSNREGILFSTYEGAMSNICTMTPAIGKGHDSFNRDIHVYKYSYNSVVIGKGNSFPPTDSQGMNVYICVCVCMYICICTYIYKYVYIYINIRINITLLKGYSFPPRNSQDMNVCVYIRRYMYVHK